MGAGVSAAVKAASPDELKETLASLDEAARKKLLSALGPVPLYKVDVKAVPLPPAPDTDERKKFEAEYLDGTTHDDDSPEGLSRRAEGEVTVRKLQWLRWEWAVANSPIFVNMLRVMGHSDENIQAMCDGRRPLAFPEPTQYDDFCADLHTLGADIEKQL
eukprot:4565589-Prymnesium_polylepis.2